MGSGMTKSAMTSSVSRIVVKAFQMDSSFGIFSSSDCDGLPKEIRISQSFS